MNLCMVQKSIIKWVFVPFICLVLIPISALDQRPFFVIMGTWSLYLIAYPLLRGVNPRIVAMFREGVLICLPLLVYALYATFLTDWDILLRIAEITTIYSVGLSTFLHLVTYQGMILERISILFLCSTSTMSMGMILVVGQYINNILFGTSFIESNQVLMIDLFLTFLGSISMSVILLLYMRWKNVMVIGSLENEEGSREGCSEEI